MITIINVWYAVKEAVITYLTFKHNDCLFFKLWLLGLQDNHDVNIYRVNLLWYEFHRREIWVTNYSKHFDDALPSWHDELT